MEVIVVGSGVSGLVAALGASAAGARVTVLEAAERLGGTTALSGGVSWLPGWESDPGGADDALTYLGALGLGDHDAAKCETFVREAPRVAAELERLSPLRWHSLPYPDYHAEFAGGTPGGRSLEPDPLVIGEEIRALVRDAPNVSLPITYRELATGEFDRAEVERRRREHILTLGRAMIAAFAAGVLERGARICTGERARALITHGDGRVTGVRTDRGDHPGRVVLASGGFERDPDLVRSLLRGPMLAPAGVPTNRGDGLRMAMACGAALGNLSEAWWGPAIQVPGETIDGAPMFRLILTERARPGSVIVDTRGRRFADEAQNYNDLGRSLHEFDPAAYAFPRVPAWMIFDGDYRRRYSIGPIRRGGEDAEWLVRGEDVGELAARIDVPATALQETLDRFAAFADAGHDEDFGRGEHVYDRFMGDARREHPVLGALREPPFYALRILPGCLGTKGGPRTDDGGRVLHVQHGGPIPGLYAAGNASASPFGLAYPGAGGTIGPGLVFGLRAGQAAAGD
jgi:3-oxosteroid 1-dehydrogenase